MSNAILGAVICVGMVGNVQVVDINGKRVFTKRPTICEKPFSSKGDSGSDKYLERLMEEKDALVLESDAPPHEPGDDSRPPAKDTQTPKQEIYPNEVMVTKYSSIPSEGVKFFNTQHKPRELAVEEPRPLTSEDGNKLGLSSQGKIRAACFNGEDDRPNDSCFVQGDDIVVNYKNSKNEIARTERYDIHGIIGSETHPAQVYFENSQVSSTQWYLNGRCGRAGGILPTITNIDPQVPSCKYHYVWETADCTFIKRQCSKTPIPGY